MTRDALFSVLYGMLGARGRDEALLGHRIADAQRAMSRMAPEGRRLNSYFEIPLTGACGVDVHAVLDKVAGTLQHCADPAWADVLDWFSGVAPVPTEQGNVLVIAEVDTSVNGDARPGIYLVQRTRADLVGPFLETLGEADRIHAWDAFRTRLPQGWETTYVGLFPGRAGGLLRVNAHPQNANAEDLKDAILGLGLLADDASLDLCRDLVADTKGFDLQLDVDDAGCPAPDFGLESYLRPKSSLSPWTDGYAERVFCMLEACGAADDRWRHLAGAEISKRAALPMSDGLASCIFSLRLFSAKVKFAQGRPALAKAYLHGDACVLEAS